MLFHEDSVWDVPVEIHVLNESIFKNKATISVKKSKHATKHLVSINHLNDESESGVKPKKQKNKKLKLKLLKQQRNAQNSATVATTVDKLSQLTCKSQQANSHTEYSDVDHSSTEQQQNRKKKKKNAKVIKCIDDQKQKNLVTDKSEEKLLKEVEMGSSKTQSKDQLVSTDKNSQQSEQCVAQQLQLENNKKSQKVAKPSKFSKSYDISCMTAENVCKSAQDSLSQSKKLRKNEKKILKRKLETEVISGDNTPQLKKQKTSAELVEQQLKDKKHSAAVVTNKRNVSGTTANSPSNSKHFNIGRLRTVLNSSRAIETVKDSQKAVNSDLTRREITQNNVSDVHLVDGRRTQEGNLSNTQGSSLKDRMMDRLAAARFRYINEQLYNSTGSDAAQMFAQDRDAFDVYHTGFQSQVEKWPMNPVDKMIDYIRKSENAVIADFGCGDAKIAQSVRNKVHSFDLVALNEHVVACDMTHVPLKSSSVDIAVFCLSLMGTNLLQYLCEAHRVLKQGGTLLIAEVVSRFDKIGGFIRKLQKLGFTLLHKDVNNTMFVWFELKKTASLPSDDRLPTIELLPCTYKKR